MNKLSQDVATKTEGQFQIKVFTTGSLVKDVEIFDAVESGMIEAAFYAPAYWKSKIPVAEVEFGLPFSWENAEEIKEVLDRGLRDILEEAYAEKGLYHAITLPVSTYGFLSTFELQSLDDLRGKKLRAVGLLASILKDLGASVVRIDPGELYMALERGLVEGIFYPYFALEAYKFKEVVKYVHLPPFQVPAVTVFFNMEAWEKLPDQYKNILQDTLDGYFFQFWDKISEMDKQGIAKAKEYGCAIVTVSDKTVEGLRTVAIAKWDEVAAKDARCAKAVSIVKEFVKEKGAGK